MDLDFFLALLKWLISCSPLVPATIVVPHIMETTGLAGFGMTRGLRNEKRDTARQLHRL